MQLREGKGTHRQCMPQRPSGASRRRETWPAAIWTLPQAETWPGSCRLSERLNNISHIATSPISILNAYIITYTDVQIETFILEQGNNRLHQTIINHTSLIGIGWRLRSCKLIMFFFLFLLAVLLLNVQRPEAAVDNEQDGYDERRHPRCIHHWIRPGQYTRCKLNILFICLATLILCRKYF